MGNMSYCRFQNTLDDLKDCYKALDEDMDEEMKPEEVRARGQLITLCQRIIDKAEEAALTAPKAKTNTYWDKSYEKKYPLPPNASIRFMLGPDEFNFIMARIERGGLYILATSIISVRPEASNAIRINMASRN